MLDLLLWSIDRLTGLQQSRRKVRVLAHQAVFIAEIGATSPTTSSDLLASPPVTGTGAPAGVTLRYFIKVTNLSKDRDIEITHVWFEADPEVPVLMPERPLPARLRPDEQWEGWTEASRLAHVTNVERAVRVRLSSGKTVKSRPNKDVPPIGYVAGRGSR
jgi:hypothetical protein